VSAGCSREATDPSTSLSEVTSTIPTGPNEDFGIKLGSSELLKNLLDFKWQDISSVTLIKYQDNIKVSTNSKMNSMMKTIP